MKRYTSRQQELARRAAVSLTELMVAVCAVALLLTLTSAAASGMRSKSKQSVCLSRLGQLIEASLIYASIDPSEYLIADVGYDDGHPTYHAAYSWGGKSGVGDTGFCDGDPEDPLTSKWGTGCGYGVFRRPLNQVLYGDVFPDYRQGTEAQQLSDTRLELEPYRCPSDSGYAGGHCSGFEESKLTSYDYYGTSYTANVILSGMSNGSGKLWSVSAYRHRASEIPAPSRTLAYWENAGRWAWATSDTCEVSPGIDPRTPDGTIGGWHGKAWTYTAAFCDGHVDTIFMHGHSQHLESQWPPGLAYGNAACLLIRGDTWQLDTLPVRRTETELNGVPGRPSYEGCVGD